MSHDTGDEQRDADARWRKYAEKILNADNADNAVFPPADEDPINHPSHYTRGGIETIDVIEAWGLNFHLGNAVKYIARAGFKSPTREIEDLKKARWYLDREIARREGNKR